MNKYQQRKSLRCDECNAFYDNVQEWETTADVRKRAAKHGWKRVFVEAEGKWKDICPRCLKS